MPLFDKSPPPPRPTLWDRIAWLLCAILIWAEAPPMYVFVLATFTALLASPFRPAVAALLPKGRMADPPWPIDIFAEGMVDGKGLFSDWQAKGITSVLHEKKGGYANNTASIYGLASKAEAEGVYGIDTRGHTDV